MRYSIQSSTLVAEVREDLSKTASGMEVTCLSEQYLDRSNDVYLRDLEDDGEYVKDDDSVYYADGTVTRNGRRVQARREWAKGDIAANVKHVERNGVHYIRLGKSASVQVWEEQPGWVAACRCGWTHRIRRTQRETYGPATYEEAAAPLLTLIKYVGIHAAAKHDI